MKKKLIAMLVCIGLVASLFAGCKSSSNEGQTGNTEPTKGASQDAAEPTDEAQGETPAIALDGTWPEEHVKIAVECFDTTDEQFLALQSYFEYLTDYYNISFIYSESIASAEDELSFIDSSAAAGCKALIAYYNVTKEEAVKACIENGMYYWSADAGLAEVFKDDEHYLGGYSFLKAGDDSSHNGDYLGGYEMGYSLAKQGAKHILYCNGGVSLGIQMFIDRQQGFFDGVAAAQAEGSTAVFDQKADVIEGWPGTDAFAAAQTAALDKDYDAIGVSFSAAVWFQPIATVGKTGQIKLATIGGVTDTFYDAFQTGQMACAVYDCEEVVFGNSIVTILNAVTGNIDIARGNGVPAAIYVNRWTVADADSFTAIYNYHDEGKFFVTPEDMAQCFPAFNPEASYQTVYDLYSALDLETALAKIK